MSGLRLVRYAAWAIVAVVLAAAAFAAWSGAFLSGQGSGTAAIGGPFRLVDQTGESVTEADLVGHPSLMFFGYTACPDICPTTLAEAGGWLGDLGADAARLRVYFVTVDPERDTEAQMARYLGAFDPRITGLTGPPAAVEAMLEAFRVYYRKVPVEGGSYTMDHIAAVYMLDPQGHFSGTFDYTDPPDEIMGKIRRLVGA